jgi:hypothetical protein
MALEQYTDEIDKNLGNDLITGMLKDRREWVQSTRQDKKVPEDVKPFYDRFKEVETEEEIAARKAIEAEERAKAKSKKKEPKKAEPGAKKGKKKKGDTEVLIDNKTVKIGSSEIV